MKPIISSFGKNNMTKIRPIEVDAHLKYSCPECSSFHWVSVKAARVPNYIMVCETCGSASFVETIRELNIVYRKEPTESSGSEKETIPKKLLSICLKSMKAYGYDADKSISAIEIAYKETGSSDPLVIVKNATKQFIGAENV